MDTQALEARLREANKLDALARFARGVAHDFNNVFTAVTANCDLLLEDIEPDDPRRPEVVAIREAIERATELTRRWLRGSPQPPVGAGRRARRSEEHTSELQSPCNIVCRLLLVKKKKKRS